MAKARPVTPMDRVRWARTIAARRAEDPPKEWREIAREVGLPVRNCQKLLKQLQETGDPDAPANPMAPIQRHLDVLETVMDEAAITYAEATRGAERVGALKLLKDASSEMIDYMRLVGFLPRQLGALSFEREAQQMFRQFAEILQRYDVPDDAVAEVLALAEQRLTAPATLEGRAIPVSAKT